MTRIAALTLLLAFAGCAHVPVVQQAERSPCEIHEASWECQIQRYREVAQ